MNVLFKLSEREKGFENEIAVKYFFTNTLINSNRGYFHVGRKMIQLKKMMIYILHIREILFLRQPIQVILKKIMKMNFHMDIKF
mgnify:CR=1 FL=1